MMNNKQKYSALIIEDDAAASDLISVLLNRYCPQVEVLSQVQSKEAALEALQQYEPNIVLADIKLGETTFFDDFNTALWAGSKLVFTTGYEEFAIRAIKANAVDYLLKPIQPTELVQAIDKCVRQVETESETNAGYAKANAEVQILVKTARGIYVIHLDEVIRCESEHGYTSFILKDKKRVVASKTLKEIELAVQWPPNFMRVHQSHLINLNHACSIAKTPGGYMVRLTDESDIPVSAANKPQLTAWLNSIQSI